MKAPAISTVDRSLRWWSALRLALVLLWLVAAVAAWWTTPREQSYEKAYLTPLGLGLLFWLVREHPWARSAPHAAPSGSGERRDRGALGFAIGLILAILHIAVVPILHKALGDWWVPRPGV